MITEEVKFKVDALWTAMPGGRQSTDPSGMAPLTWLSRIASEGQTSPNMIGLVVAMIPPSRPDLRSRALT